MRTTEWTDNAELVPAPNGRGVTIGAFDGVHLGHQAVLRLVRDLARARDLIATVVTFDRHPAEVVRPAAAPKTLTTLDQKLELIEATGAVDECIVLRFDETRSHEPAEQFVEEVLADALRTRLIVVGSDFHFGYRRHGDVPLLQRMGAELGFEVLGLGLVASPDGAAAADGALPYSSTRIRALLAEGNVAAAATILGRPHEVRAPITLAGETATVTVPARICLPAPGTYEVEIDADGRRTDGTVRVADDDSPDAGTRTMELTGAGPAPKAAIKFVGRLPG